jgi:NAD-dependent SIR2 family protein deacetylase
MATLRAKSRWASLSKFHQFLHRAFDNGLVARWLTRNFDGLETRDRPDLVDHVLMVHGDNQVLRCASPDCPGISGDAVVELDMRLLRGELVMCPACFTPGEISWNSSPMCPLTLNTLNCFHSLDGQHHTKRMRHNTSISKYLRPAVLLDERIDFELEAGQQLVQLLSSTDNAELFLIVGTSLKSDAVNNIIRDVARAVHSTGGAVVYIDRQAPNKRKWNQYIDFHLQVDIEDCATRLLQSMDMVSPVLYMTCSPRLHHEEEYTRV